MNNILAKIISEDAVAGVQTGAGMGVGGAFGTTDGYNTTSGNADARNPVPFRRRKSKKPTVQRRTEKTMKQTLAESIINPQHSEIVLNKILNEGDESARVAMGYAPTEAPKSRSAIILERIQAGRRTLEECKTIKGKLAAKKAAIEKARAAKGEEKPDGAKAKLLARKKKLHEAVQNLRQKRLLEERAKRIEAAKKRILEARAAKGGKPVYEGKSPLFNKTREMLIEARANRLRKQRLMEARERLIEAKKKKVAAAPKEKICPTRKKPRDCKTGKCVCPPVKK